jgi:pyruvate/2-oxoglutarate dehydrogenase complex dihydrolipoamide acyltransferase (E2) component
MALPLRAPRLNNNDDFVQIRQILIGAGSRVKKGDAVIELETDKAVFEVEAERGGFILRVDCAVGDTAPVGTVLAWIGDSADEALPDTAEKPAEAAAEQREPTLKAKMLLDKYGLRAEQIPQAGERLTAQDVEAYAQQHPAAPQAAAPDIPLAPGTRRPLNAEERGMLKTVSWQRDHAVAGYIELQYDPKPWEEYAAAFMKEQRLLFNPLLPLMAWRLASLPAENSKLNATIAAGELHVYERVNLGFTVQSGASLFLAVLQQADGLEAAAFVGRLGELQRRAAARHLSLEESSNATLSFSSMARWPVSRHVPVLPPFTSLIVAHAAPPGGPAVLGGTYDHRVLSGFDVVKALGQLAKPPA